MTFYEEDQAPGRAGIIYRNGLRRYLIIFDPHTLVLD